MTGVFLEITDVVESEWILVPVGVKFSEPLRKALGRRQALK
jgi:hypothetical protein